MCVCIYPPTYLSIHPRVDLALSLSLCRISLALSTESLSLSLDLSLHPKSKLDNLSCFPSSATIAWSPPMKTSTYRLLASGFARRNWPSGLTALYFNPDFNPAYPFPQNPTRNAVLKVPTTPHTLLLWCKSSSEFLNAVLATSQGLLDDLYPFQVCSFAVDRGSFFLWLRILRVLTFILSHPLKPNSTLSSPCRRPTPALLFTKPKNSR